MKKTVFAFAVLLLLLAVSCATRSVQPEETFVIYEGVFIDNVNEVFNLAAELRGGKAPLQNVKDEFHVTVAYLPESPLTEKYGAKVTVRVTAYDREKMLLEDGKEVESEAMSVVLVTSDEVLDKYIADNLESTPHITLSYTNAPKDSMNIDFGDAKEISFDITGTFGAYVKNVGYIFSPELAP